MVRASAPSYRVLHGDSCLLVRELGKFDLVLTDPPYAVRGRRREWQSSAIVAAALCESARAVRTEGAMAVFTSASRKGELLVEHSVGFELTYCRQVVWHKTFVRSPAAGPFRWDIVPIRLYGRASFGRPKVSSCFVTEGPSRPPDDSGHPGQLPDSLCDWLVSAFDDGSPKRVLDPFCGTGALLAPCVRRGWEVVGIDVEPRWVEVAETTLAEAAS